MDSVHAAMLLVAIAATVIVVARLSPSIGLPTPLVLLGVGVLGSFLPFVPTVDLSPDLALHGLLPPLLYAAAINTSLIGIRANLRPIIGLSVGLVLFTAFAVALVASWLLPIPFGIALALGAIVAPPDAVAATAVARQIGFPRRITTILEGESLLNDATALVTLRTAIAASGLAIEGQARSGVGPMSVSVDFAWAVVGGVGIGVLAFLVIGTVRKHLTDTAADTVLSFAAPFVAYVPAEGLGASGVLAVVTTGLLLAHKAPVLQSAASRLSERINWRSVTFLLENAVFLLIGLQVSQTIDEVEGGDLSVGQAFGAGFVVLLVCLVTRPAWVFPFVWVSDRLSKQDRHTSFRLVSITAWAGMRGVVTLAAALTLPETTPERPTLVLCALIVTVGTLSIQGLTLPSLARALDVRGPDPREDALVEATVVQAATAAGLRVLDDDIPTDPRTVESLKREAKLRVNRVWERLGSLGTSETETPSEAYRRLRLEMLDAQRHELVKIRSEGQVDHEILTTVMNQLDAEEAALEWGVNRQARLRQATLKAPDQVAVACDHLATAPNGAVPNTPEGCEECLRDGTTWVHLRLCLECGHVGCCDSSTEKHARVHFHEETDHPVMRSLEPGEAWRWCFVDEVLG